MKLRIPYMSGIVREMQCPDIQRLTEMSNERDVLKNYFNNVPMIDDSMWHRRLVDNNRGIEFSKKGQVRNDYNLSIEDHGNVVGFIGMQLYPYRVPTCGSVKKHLIEIHYFVGSEHREHGIATKAVGKTVSYASKNLNAGGIDAVVAVDNIASQKLLTTLGFTRDPDLITLGGGFGGTYGRRFRMGGTN